MMFDGFLRSAFQSITKRIRETFCLYLRFGKTLTTNKKAHGYTVSISAFLRSKFEICRFQVYSKSKNAFNYMYLLLFYLYFALYLVSI